MKRLRHYKQGTAIVLSCFGSKKKKKRYEALKQKIAERYPQCEVRLAVSSRMVIKLLAKKGGEYSHLPSVMAELDLEGYQRILVVSCYLFPTDEHKQVELIVDGFRQFSLSRIERTPAIIHHTHRATDLLTGLNHTFSEGSDINLFVHHGAPYLDNAGHQAIGYVDSLLGQLSEKNISCSLEGAFPFGIVKSAIERRIKNIEGKPKLRIIPMLLVSGNHFIKDMVEIKQALSDICDVEIAEDQNGDSFNLISTPEVMDIIVAQIEQGLGRLRVPTEDLAE